MYRVFGERAWRAEFWSWLGVGLEDAVLIGFSSRVVYSVIEVEGIILEHGWADAPSVSQWVGQLVTPVRHHKSTW